MTDLKDLVESLKDLDGDQLKRQIEVQKKDVKVLSKKTIIDNYNLGKLLTVQQLNEIKSLIDPLSIKSVIVQKAIIDKKTQKFEGYKPVTKYFNKWVTRLDSAITAGLITDEESLINMNILEADSASSLNTKMLDVSHARGELHGLRAVEKAREATAARATLEKKALKIQTLGEIYKRSVDANKLIEADRAEASIENATNMDKAAKDAVAEKMLHPSIVTETPIFV